MMLLGHCDLIIEQATIADEEKSYRADISLKNGRIHSVNHTLTGTTSGSLSAGGKLVIPGFVNAHTHLDKADLLTLMTHEEFGYTLEQNRKLIRRFKKEYSIPEVKERAGKVALEMLQHGITALRTQVDVDPTAGLTPLKALLQLKEELADKMTIQVSAFPQEGVIKAGAYEMIEEALKDGADVLGGLPLVEEGRENQEKHIDLLFRLAMKYDRNMDVQIDESNDPQDFILPYLAEKTIREGFQGRVAATHCISLSAVDDASAMPVIQKMADAKMTVIITPSCNLITRFPEIPGSRPHNSITRIKDLVAAGVTVALGTDNIRDIFYPLGNCSMIREMHVLATAMRMSRPEDIDALLDMATVNPARLLGLDYGLETGKAADLLVTGADSKRLLICGSEEIPIVLKNGVMV
jgi:cytosine deaminase